MATAEERPRTSEPPDSARPLARFAWVLLRTGLRATWSGVGDVLSPPACAACDAIIRRQQVFCSECALQVSRCPLPTGEGTLAAVDWTDPVRTAVARLKYQGRPDLARPLGHLLRALLRAHPVQVDCVIPVPLHPVRLAERGYNQAALLAREVAVELEVPLLCTALVRLRGGPRQASLGRDARLTNVEDVFRVRTPRRIADRKILLVDDVVTTGSTLLACERALLAAGAREIRTATVARAG